MLQKTFFSQTQASNGILSFGKGEQSRESTQLDKMQRSLDGVWRMVFEKLAKWGRTLCGASGIIPSTALGPLKGLAKVLWASCSSGEFSIKFAYNLVTKIPISGKGDQIGKKIDTLRFLKEYMCFYKSC